MCVSENLIAESASASPAVSIPTQGAWETLWTLDEKGTAKKENKKIQY